MKKPDCPNVEKASDRCVGRAVVAGTRTRVGTVLACYPPGNGDRGVRAHLRPADVHDALAHVYEHADEIEADLADDDEDSVQRKYSGGDSG